MSKRPWFPLYVGDLLSDTMNFDAPQFGGYVKILCHYWVTEEPMSVDEMRVASGLSKNLFQKSWPLLEKKFVLENGNYFNRRMRREILKAVDISDKRSAAGSKAHQAIAPTKAKQKPTQLQSQSHKEKSSTPRKRSTQLKTDWILPEDYKEYCQTKRPELNPELVAENFKDYYLSVGKPMADWKRTWQRWVRNEHGTTRKAGNGTSAGIVQTPHDRHLEALRRRQDSNPPLGRNDEAIRKAV
jgi:uncharacterized protein YdaU (DUF1376 family)